ncbi:MAG: 30S ribosomal protein S6 [Gammaproteobacteria bacterium]|nr:30S ribosomal protein S6 [Gammaproteobacteria bacterium]
MRHYEIVLLVHPDQSDQLSDMLRRYQDSVTKNGGKIHRIEDIGRLQLAYTIKDMHKAHYVLMNLECNNETLSEIESSFVFNDSIMRHLVVKMDNAETEPSKLFLLHGKGKDKGKDAKKIDTKASLKDSKIESNTEKLTEVKDEEESKDIKKESKKALNEPDMKISKTQKEENDDEKAKKSKEV